MSPLTPEESRAYGTDLGPSLDEVFALALPKPVKRARKPRAPIRRSKRPAYLRVRGGAGKLRKLADDAMSLFVRSRDGWTCVKCGKVENVQNAHIQPKGDYPAGRYREDNAVALCYGCHRYFTGRAYDWRLFIGPDRFDNLGREFSGALAKWDKAVQARRFLNLVNDNLALATFPRPELHAMIRERLEALEAQANKLEVLA